MDNFEANLQNHTANLYARARGYSEAFGDGPLADVAAGDQEYAAEASRNERASRGLSE